MLNSSPLQGLWYGENSKLKTNFKSLHNKNAHKKKKMQTPVDDLITF